MNLSTEALVRSAAERPWRMVGIWVAGIIVGLVIAGTLFGSAITNEDRFMRSPDAIVAEDLLEESGLRDAEKINEFLIVGSRALTVDDQAFKDRVDSLLAEVNGLGPVVVEGAVSYYLIGDPGLVSEDRRTTIIPIVMAGDLDDAVDNVGRLREIELGADGVDGFEVVLTGASSFGKDFEEISQGDLATEQ